MLCLDCAGLSVGKGQEVQRRLAEFAGNAEGPHRFGKGQAEAENGWESGFAIEMKEVKK